MTWSDRALEAYKTLNPKYFHEEIFFPLETCRQAVSTPQFSAPCEVHWQHYTLREFPCQECSLGFPRFFWSFHDNSPFGLLSLLAKCCIYLERILCMPGITSSPASIYYSRRYKSWYGNRHLLGSGEATAHSASWSASSFPMRSSHSNISLMLDFFLFQFPQLFLKDTFGLGQGKGVQNIPRQNARLSPRRTPFQHLVASADNHTVSSKGSMSLMGFYQNGKRRTNCHGLLLN